MTYEWQIHDPLQFRRMHPFDLFIFSLTIREIFEEKICGARHLCRPYIISIFVSHLLINSFRLSALDSVFEYTTKRDL